MASMEEHSDVQVSKRIRLDPEAIDANHDTVLIMETEVNPEISSLTNAESNQETKLLSDSEINQDTSLPVDIKVDQDTSILVENEANQDSGLPKVPEAGPDVPRLTVSEESVGVTEFYLTRLPGFKGIIKKRFSDFIVREITLAGNTLYCSKNKASSELRAEKPASNGDAAKSQTEEPVAVEAAELVSEPSEEFYGGIQKLFSLEDNDPLLSQLKEMVSSKGKVHREGIVMPHAIVDKAQRTAIHQFVKEKGMGKLDTTTIDGKIAFKFQKKGARNFRQSRQEASSQAYTHFTLYKENRDTMTVVNLIARTMHQETKAFGFAGTKDKRGITLQRMSAYKIPEARLAGLNKGLRGVFLSDFSTASEPIRLGDLKGNHFTIVVRELKGSQDFIEGSLQSFKMFKMFFNYFGMQRFGTSSVPTHFIGLELLKSNWENAVSLILDPRDGDDKEIHEARCLWRDTRDPKACLEKFPSFLVAERAVLGSLCKDPRNFLEAIKRIPRTLRLMYVHAYQSYVWNKAVSARIATFGPRPIRGDLISPTEVLDDESRFKYHMCHVVLPLPGVDMKYPSYPEPLQNLYQDIMSQDGLDPMNMHHTEKDFCLSGDYRKVAVEVGDFTW
ncbi:multisubstrate pseudouridine synthase 7, variant 2 [Entomophthora muscae]|nr:multisubstrate pseudouridine synthase 7, variant 2 [Entomophthora muscae]